MTRALRALTCATVLAIVVPGEGAPPPAGRRSAVDPAAMALRADASQQEPSGVCGLCHTTHDATASARLLNAYEEAVCLQCHDGGIAPGQQGIQPPNIEAELQKPYVHPVLITPSVHSPAESPTSTPLTLPETDSGQPRHVECVDCHDHHGFERTSGPRFHSPAIFESWGIAETGAYRDPALYEYETCLKCHGDSANRPQINMTATDYPRRQSTVGTPYVFNTRLEVQSTNASFHPLVTGLNLTTGFGGEVPSLRSYMVSPGGSPLPTRALLPSSTINCTDCHNNDAGRQLGSGGTNAAGPHGSDYPFLLERRYMLEPPVAFPGSDGPGVFYSPDAYALCDKCHDLEGSVLRDESFPQHAMHIREEDASCSTCHAPHGVFGGTALNNTHLIDFDTRIVGPDSFGRLRFEDQGFQAGSCYLTCHGEEHAPESY